MKVSSAFDAWMLIYVPMVSSLAQIRKAFHISFDTKQICLALHANLWIPPLRLFKELLHICCPPNIGVPLVYGEESHRRPIYIWDDCISKNPLLTKCVLFQEAKPTYNYMYLWKNLGQFMTIYCVRLEMAKSTVVLTANMEPALVLMFHSLKSPGQILYLQPGNYEWSGLEWDYTEQLEEKLSKLWGFRLLGGKGGFWKGWKGTYLE